MKRLYIQTYGCQMNQYDSDRILQIMRRMDYTSADNAEEADLILLNTCSVRNKAEQKVYSALGRWRELKQKKSGLIIGVGGCVAQQEGKALLRRIPFLDLVFGTHNIHKLPQMVQAVQLRESRPVETAFYRDPAYMDQPEGRTEVQGTKAYITIMQGCNKVCSFCIVPYVRGREISRPSGNIIGEVGHLAEEGIKEVMLLGQNVNSYGKTRPGELTFAQLLTKINDIEGLERIRFTTSHPEDLSLELIDAYERLDKLCEHLHLPVQTGSDSVLKRMRRGYTRNDYMNRIRRLRRRCPGVALTTDIIVGFPGETAQEFEQTLDILQEVEYDEIFAFTYSPRPHTLAAKLYPNAIPDAVKKSRLAQVLSLQNKISFRKNEEERGSVKEVLLEGPSKQGGGQIMGRTRTNKVINLNGEVHLSGTMARVRIISATANSLYGELVSTNPDSVPVEARGIA
ncbi:MAG: tRNA (N6-isopentenyl adenosine(37)-C2)-methylthiotransferase MiaB [Candidatus Binatia bacterium]